MEPVNSSKSKLNSSKNKLNSEIIFIFKWYPNKGVVACEWRKKVCNNSFYPKEKVTERWCRERKRRKRRFHDREDKGEREKIKEIESSFFWSLKINSKYVHTQEICVHFPSWSQVWKWIIMVSDFPIIRLSVFMHWTRLHVNT